MAGPARLPLRAPLSLAVCLMAVALLARGAGSTPMQCPSTMRIQEAGDWPQFFGTKERIAGIHRYPLCNTGDNSKGTIKVSVWRKPLGTVWKGWGTTLGEMGAFLGSLDAESSKCLARLLFHPTGMGLNAARYHIPGGYNPTYSPKLAKNRLASRGYWPLPRSRWAPFDLKADLYQVRFLRNIKALFDTFPRAWGSLVLEAVSYSAPWWMTYSKRTEGSNKHSQPNLMPLHYANYSRYLKAVVQNLEGAYGLRFDAIAPMNEPLEGWWVWNKKKLHMTEGCNFNPKDINQFLPVLAKALGRRKIAGVDSWVKSSEFILRKSNTGDPKFFTAETTRIIDRYDVHGYKVKQSSYSEDERQMVLLKRWANRDGKSIWQTEWGPLGIAKAADIDNALLMSRKIIQHINVLQVEAWFHWQAIQSYAKQNKHWGPIRLVMKAPVKAVYLTKSYYAFKHFSTFIRPGAMPVTVSPTCKHTVSAVQYGSRLTITLVNQRSPARLYNIYLRGYTCLPAWCSVYRYITTNDTSFMQAVAKTTAVTGSKLKGLFQRSQKVPAFSLVTLVLVGVRSAPII